MAWNGILELYSQNEHIFFSNIELGKELGKRVRLPFKEAKLNLTNTNIPTVVHRQYGVVATGTSYM